MTQLTLRHNFKQLTHDLPVTELTTLDGCATLCEFIGRNTISDLRTQVWDIHVHSAIPFQVGGYSSSIFPLHALSEASKILNNPCDSKNVTILPEKSLQDRTFGLVTSPECFLYSSPDHSDTLDMPAYGESLYLLRMSGSHTLVQTQSGYIGWVEAINYRTLSSSEWLDWIHPNRIIFVVPQTLNSLFIPGGAELPSLSGNEVRLPTGSRITVQTGMAIPSPGVESQQRKALCAVALSLLDTPYVWGGTSARGFDCSGLVRYIYWAIGCILPRDADQQFLCGRISALPNLTRELTAGDLLFFYGKYGRVKHVAMALNPHEFIHAHHSQGVVITRLDQEEELMRRFILAKRVIR